MNSLRVVLHHDFFKYIEDSQFYIEYEHIHLDLQHDKKHCQLIAYLRSNKESLSTLEEEFTRLHLLFFLMMGSCPRIISKELNDEKFDIDDLSLKFFTDDYYHDISFCLSLPNSKNVRGGLLELFKSITIPKKVSIISFYSLQALVSEAYKNVFIDHKLTLLLQTIDGMINKEQGFDKKEIIKIIIGEWPDVKKQDIGDLFPKIYFLASETIFPYENRCRILKVLGKNKKEFLDAIIHTRHFYSHMLSLDERRKRLTEGKDLRVYFDILVY